MTSDTRRPLRVAVATHRSGHAGGAEQYLATIIPALVAAGHDVSCWVETETNGGAALPSDLVTTWTAGAHPQNALRALADWQPDVIFAHGLASPDHERQLMALGPSVCFAHSYYGTCISGSKTHRSPGMQCCTRRFGPACLVSYYPRRCGGWSPLTLLSQFELQRSRLSLLRDYDRIVVASRHMAAEYARHGLHEKTRVVSLPIETHGSPGVRGADSDSIRLLYVGRLEETKGVHIAIDSAAMVASSTRQKTELQVSGEGSCEQALKVRAARAMARQPLLSVTFTGWLERAQCADSFDDADLLLVPSLWPEPFGMVGVEAGVRGLPAVAFAVGGIPEWLSDGVNGRLVTAEPPDATRFAEAIMACISQPAALSRMRERAAESARRFSVAAHVTELSAVLCDVAQPTRRREAVQ